MIKTYMAKPADVKHGWVHIDATDQILGRLATRIATILMGKDKPTYTQHVDVGDFVVVTNVEKVCLTGKKWQKKVYRHHTGYLGHLREVGAETMRDQHPERVLEFAVRRMLPKTKLGDKMIKKLKLHAGPEHCHQAQQPKDLDVASTRRN